jgi:hypothetical protein
MRLQARAFGLASGITLGVAGFLATFLSLVWGGGNTITVLAVVYFGYSWSAVGAVVALFWGLVYGFIGGWLLATVYNRLATREAAGAPGV